MVLLVKASETLIYFWMGLGCREKMKVKLMFSDGFKTVELPFS